MAYATIDMVKSQLKIDADDSRRDDEISSALEAATGSIDEFCHRRFGRYGSQSSPLDREYEAAGALVVIDDLVDLRSADAQSGDAWVPIDLSGLVLLPRNAIVDDRPATMIKTRSGGPLPLVLRITGVWGWPSTPAPVVEACVIETVAIMSAKSAPSGDSGGDPLLSLVRPTSDLHPKAKQLVSQFQRAGIG